MALYVLASAVNFDATIFDGNELSVIRGSSARLLRAVEDLYAHFCSTFEARAVVERLSVGASELVIRLSAPSVAAPPPKPPPGLTKTKWKEARKALVTEAAGGKPVDQAVDAWLKTRQGRGAAAARDAVIAQVDGILRARAAQADVPDEAAVCAAMRAFRALPAQRKLAHFVFLHACHRSGPDEWLCDIFAVLYSRLRARQLQKPTLALPDIVTPLPPASRAFCTYTLGRRPALPTNILRQPVSRSALSRRSNGRWQKQNFYMLQLRRSADAAARLQDDDAQRRLAESMHGLENDSVIFAHDFEAIVAGAPATLPPNVRNKLAVLFMDGNGFGARRAACTSVVRKGVYDNSASHHAYRRFCLALERNGGLILAGLLDWMRGQPDFGGTRRGERYLRFETLLFGGDDICVVMPAWGAFALLGELSNVLAGLRVPNAEGAAERVAFGIGVAIADRRSPIRDLRRVANELSSAAKETDRGKSIVHVMALEGLDRADLDPDRLRQELFGDAAENKSRAFGLALADIPEIAKVVVEIGRHVGRSQLHKWYRKAEDDGLLRMPGDHPDVENFLEKCKKRLGELGASDAAICALTGKSPLLAAGAERWPLLPLHHILTLADYIEAMPIPAPETRAAA